MKASTIAGVLGALALGGVAIAQTSSSSSTPDSSGVATTGRTGASIDQTSGSGMQSGGPGSATGYNTPAPTSSDTTTSGAVNSRASSAPGYGADASSSAPADTGSGATGAGPYGTDTAAGERG